MGHQTELIDLTDPNYTPGILLDEVARRLQVRSDAAMAQLLNIDIGSISRLRHKRLPLTPFHYVQMMDALPDLRLSEIRKLCGVTASVRPVYPVRSLVKHVPGIIANGHMQERLDLVRKMAQAVIDTANHFQIDLLVFKDDMIGTVFTVAPKREAA